MILLSNVLAREVPRPIAVNSRMIMIPAPELRLLPPRRVHPKNFLASISLHAIAMAAFLWLPRLFPTPVILANEEFSKPEPLITPINEPLILPELSKPSDARPAPAAHKTLQPVRDTTSQPVRDNGVTAKSVIAPPRTPDYTAPQTIISEIPNAVNRIQTIQRPDLVAPPNLKYPLRLQSVVMLPSSAAPLLAPRPPQPSKPVPTITSEDIPVLTPTVETPVLTLTPKQGSVIKSKTARSRNVSPNLKAVSGTQPNALKALVVVNAVNVVPDPSAVVPDAQLAGKFVVGPSPENSGGADPPSGAKPSPAASAEHSPSPGAGHPSTSEKRTAAGNSSGNPSSSGNKSGTGLTVSPKPGNGSGTTASVNAGGSGSTTANSAAPGITISGGIPGPNQASVAKALPQRPSYPLMIISGGSSGGASRDMGVFGRTETVYSVSIPMANGGGGSDWTMQYALLNGHAGAGLLVPPMAQKKVAAIMKSSVVSSDAGPVFLSAVIDENGKLQALKSLRPQDTRSQAALCALEQWEFLPAQLDGKPVSSKILLGVAVMVVE